MENNSKNKSISYTTESYFSNNKKKKEYNHSKNFFISFLSGILGACLVICTCIGVPSIREKVIGNIEIQNINSISQNNSNNISKEISLSDFSDTGINVAEKVRPSIVGIKVNYSVNSIFSKGRNSNS